MKTFSKSEATSPYNIPTLTALLCPILEINFDPFCILSNASLRLKQQFP
jgi:hypothetical protein